MTGDEYFDPSQMDVCGAAADLADKGKKKGRKAMDEAMHVVKQSMTDVGGMGYFHVCCSCSSSCPSLFFPSDLCVVLFPSLTCFSLCFCHPASSAVPVCPFITFPCLS